MDLETFFKETLHYSVLSYKWLSQAKYRGFVFLRIPS